MHLKRVIVAAIALPLFYFYITKLPPVFFLSLLILIAALAQIEFHSMYKTKRTFSSVGVISGVILIISSAFIPQYSLQIALLLFMAILTSRLLFIRDPSASLRDIAPVALGFLYIPGLLLPQWYLRLQGYEWIILLYGCVWIADSFAYYIGKGFGKRKLYKEVSPNKTMEGALGSVIGGILSALLLGSLLFKDFSLSTFILIGGVTGSVTIVGDLVESMFKRDAGVKDSGSLIPGHGGVLDKIDGILFAGPMLYLIVTLLK